MPTNYPTNFDDASTLGTLFTDVVPITDPVTQIAATYRVNIKDAMYAVQARLGIDGSTVPTSLSWATLSAGGTNNLGLRFAGSSATWPGTVAESGIFLESSGSWPVYHRGGDAIGTFYYLTGIASMVTLQAAYDGGAIITTSGVADLDFRTTAGDNFIIRHAAGTCTQWVCPASTLTTGLLDVNCTTIAATNVMAVNATIDNAVNNQEFGSYLAVVDDTGDLFDTGVIYGFATDLTMGGDGPAAPGRALGASFYARSAAFTGANVYESAGLLVDGTFDWGVLSESTLRVEVPINEQAIQVDSDPTALEAAIMVATVGTDATSGFFAGYTGTIATPVALRYYFGTEGDTTINANSISPALELSQASTGLFLECIDPAGPTTMLQVAKDGAITANVNSANHCLTLDQTGAGGYLLCQDAVGPTTRFRVGPLGITRIFVDGITTNSALVLTHGNALGPFVDLDGTYNAAAISGNITDEDTGGAVVGPGANVWSFAGLVRVQISGGGGGITDGDYWVALYN